MAPGTRLLASRLVSFLVVLLLGAAQVSFAMDGVGNWRVSTVGPACAVPAQTLQAPSGFPGQPDASIELTSTRLHTLTLNPQCKDARSTNHSLDSTTDSAQALKSALLWSPLTCHASLAGSGRRNRYGGGIRDP